MVRLVAHKAARLTLLAALASTLSTTLLSTQANAADLAAEPSPAWSYHGETGAGRWGDLAQEYTTCKLGMEQSPIDIRNAVEGNLPALAFDYRQTVANVVNNGHTIQVDMVDGGAIALADGKYKLLQFHFHTPSEERIDGKAYPLVAHLVHRNDAGRLAVVGVLFEEGAQNALLERVFSTMSSRIGTAIKLPGGIDANALLPAERAYYAFAGSLTTPPCTEGVQWRILKHPLQISAEQLQAFQRLYPMNARPVQPLNGRTIESSR